MSGEGFIILGFIISILSLIGFTTSEILIMIRKRKIKNELNGGE